MTASCLISERKLEKQANEITPSTVTRGKSRSNHNEQCCGAGNVVDKDLSTHAVTDTVDGTGWLKLEFDRTYFIDKTVIYTRFYTDWYDPNHGCLKNEAGFKACVDSDNNVDVSVYQGEVKQKSCGTLQLTYGLEQSDQIYTLVCNVEGDSVKLSKSTGVIAVYEIVIFQDSGNV